MQKKLEEIIVNETYRLRREEYAEPTVSDIAQAILSSPDIVVVEKDRLEAAEAVAEEVEIKHWPYEYQACPYMECPICRKLDNWRKVKEGKCST